MTYILPDWPAPARVNALVTSRRGGVSQAPFDSFNTASHVGDNPEAVAANRNMLSQRVGCPIQWLLQVHGTDVHRVTAASEMPFTADGLLTDSTGLACAVQTADCLPVLICDQNGDQIAALHAGWKGLAGGIIQNGINLFDCLPEKLLVYLGPAISARFFEVGEDVLEAFSARFGRDFVRLGMQRGFAQVPSSKSEPEKKYMADLYLLSRIELASLGVKQIYGGSLCTYGNASEYYSYRRDGRTGRIASVIWKSD